MINIEKCPVCLNAEAPIPFLKCNDNTGSDECFNIVACIDCGFKYTSPIPSEKEIGKYYESDEYISHTNSNKGLFNKAYQTVRNITLKQKLDLLNSIKPGATLLDYGCGTGDFIGFCKKNGLEVHGLEPSEQGRKTALHNHNISVNTPDKLLSLSAQQFDIITLWHVLEHIHKLEETITNLLDKLKQNGRLIIAVPNCDSYDAVKYKEKWAAYDLPRHLYHFTPKNISDLFKRFNVTVEKTIPMKWDAFYVSMLSEKYLHGKNNHINAFFTGAKSNNLAKSSGNYSSLIYVLKKT